jgi:DNA repair protein RadD
MYQLREYQITAVEKSTAFLKAPFKDNGIIVLPTGSGKSLVIAGIAQALDEPTIIFQPSKEILEQNYLKYTSYGNRASVWSASLGMKEMSKVTFATIGSVRKIPYLFKHFKYIIIDECHLVNSKTGMYKQFIETLDKAKVLGLTATPYRLTTDGWGGSILKFLTRTRPRVFQEVIYYVQNKTLFDAGHLAKLEYFDMKTIERDKLKLNSTGADYDERALKKVLEETNFKDKIVKIIQRLVNVDRKNILVFTSFIEEARYLASKFEDAEIVTGETPKAERERIINGFKAGKIRTVCNVGVLTTGFDYPELSTIILARPTMSLSLYYQMVGRGIRPHESKKTAWIIDMCGNTTFFGKVEDLKINPGINNKWYISNNGKILTNVYYGNRK